MAFDLGTTPEEIVQRYPSVALASAYALIAYALRNRDSVDTYLAERARAVIRRKPSLKCVSHRWHQGPLAGAARRGAMIRFAADDDFNNEVVRALRRALPEVDWTWGPKARRTTGFLVAAQQAFGVDSNTFGEAQDPNITTGTLNLSKL